MLDHESCQLGVQVVEEHDIAVAHLVQDRDQMALTIGSTLGSLHGADIRDVAVVTNRIIIDKVSHLLDKAIVANGDIPQGSVVDACMFGEPAGHLHLLLKNSQADVAIEHHPVEAVRRKRLGNLNIFPILGPTAVALKHIDFFLCQLSVFSHK